jgi:murein L,D-transpeptidase YcbB/YkuD
MATKIGGVRRSRWPLWVGLALLAAALLWFVPGPWSGTVRGYSSEKVAAGVRGTLSGESTPDLLKDVSLDTRGLASFYKSRNHQPLWIGDGGVRPEAKQLLAELERAEEEGLRPADYHVDKLSKALGPVSAADPAAIELLLSQAYADYARHLRQGRAPRRMIYTDDALEPARITTRSALLDAAEADSLEAHIEGLDDLNSIYAGLRAALAKQRGTDKVARLAPPVPAGETLKPGDTDLRVPALRARLGLTGEAQNPQLYDAQVADAVRAFQRSKGLKADGVLGAGTLAYINAKPADAVRKILINMERARWLPAELPDRYVLADVPGFKLRMVSGGAETGQMRIVVGKNESRTPMLADRMEYVEVNPYWNVPDSILQDEIAPAVLSQGPSYLSSRNMEVVSGYGDESFVLDASEVDWNAAVAGAADFRVRQRPGAKNSLGRMKFMFPNEYDIYLHDTPADSLFGRDLRAFSHGCVRVEKPGVLAAWVLQGQSEGREGGLTPLLDSGRTEQIKLKEKLPVFLTYFTAWPTANGGVEFRPDIYRRDADLLRRLA